MGLASIPMPLRWSRVEAVRLRCDTWSMGGGVLRDEDQDRRLQRDGFVVVPILEPRSASELRNRFGELHGWSGDGFHSDLTVADPDYRRRASDVLAAALDDAVTSRFVSHEPFLRNFLCKFPGESSSLYLHRDWMYVDERSGDRTYVAWIALEDITGHNGQLRVLRGSHLLDDAPRGTNLIAPWLRHVDVIEPRLLSVPVRAGECVIFDNRIVHCSFPNHTSVPRLAAAVGLRPPSAPLVHFRRSDDSTAELFTVDEEFFLAATPQALMAERPALDVIEQLPDGQVDLSAGQLESRLDTGALARLDRVRAALTRVSTSVSAAFDVAGASARNAVVGVRRSARAVGERLHGTRRAVRSALREAPSRAAIIVLGVNEAVISRFGPATPAVWDPNDFDWASAVEAAYPEIRSEVEALLDGPTDIPHIEDVTGGIPQGNVGPWRSFVLMHQGRWIDWNCERCPVTTSVVEAIPGLTMAGFSVLEPGTHITEHRGPNKGALRYQLGVIVPGDPGQCRIRVGDDMLVWRDGESVMFDFTVPHEAWNDSDGIRVLLMLEVVTPLPWYLDRPNRLAQRSMGWFPTTRDITARLRALEPKLRRVG